MRAGNQAWAWLAVIVMILAGLGVAATLPVWDDVADDAVPTSVYMDRDRNKIFDSLDLQMAGTGQGQAISVIVLTTTPVETVFVEQSLGSAIRMHHIYRALPGFAADLTPEQIRQLAAQDWVRQIEPDLPVQALMDTAASFHGAIAARTDFGVDGDGDGRPGSYSPGDVVIAVIDTGIDARHMDLSGKVIGWKDWINDRPEPYDDNGHGTHVAGIAAGAGVANPAFRGVAPGAALVGLKVLNGAGSGTLSDVAAAVDWSVTNKDRYNIRVISMSLGTSGSSDGTDSVSLAVNRAVEAGIVAVVAAGNSGPGRSTIGSPGAAERAITVGAMADPGEQGFHLAAFSSRGPTRDDRLKPEIAAPGVNINAPRAGTSNGYIVHSGTSMATPFVSGTVALLLDANPGMTPASVRALLTDTALDWGIGGPDIDYGAGRLDSYAAVRTAAGGTGSGPPVPVHRNFNGTLSGAGQTADLQFEVRGNGYPLAVTLIMPDWVGRSSPDFDLYLLDPSGREVGRSTTVTRQELITANAGSTGTYTIRVYSYVGSGRYAVDVSGDIAAESGPGPDQPPRVVIVAPEEGATMTGVAPVHVTAGDDRGLNSVAVAVDTGPWQDVTNSFDGTYYTYAWDTRGVANGAHSVRARATDTDGQQAEDRRQVTVANATGVHRKEMRGRVSGSVREVWFGVEVGDRGYLDLTLGWATAADLDFYAYGPNGEYVGRAYTLRNPEQLRVDTERYGIGTYRVRVHLYGGPETDFTLTGSGYAVRAFTGTVSTGLREVWHPIEVPISGISRFVLSWRTGADLDFYLYDPPGQERGRAFTLRNPEILQLPLDLAGAWRVRVHLYSGPDSTYDLKAYLPAAILN